MNAFISREQDYALRIAARLAGLKKGEQLSISELSQGMYISKIFAARIVHKLKHSGILATTQGKRGGVSLNVSPAKLTVYQVLNVIGFKVKYNNCLYKDLNCKLMGACRFHVFFKEQEKLLIQNLKKMKISNFTFKKINNNGGH